MQKVFVQFSIFLGKNVKTNLLNMPMKESGSQLLNALIDKKEEECFSHFHYGKKIRKKAETIGTKYIKTK